MRVVVSVQRFLTERTRKVDVTQVLNNKHLWDFCSRFPVVHACAAG